MSASRDLSVLSASWEHIRFIYDFVLRLWQHVEGKKKRGGIRSGFTHEDRRTEGQKRGQDHLTFHEVRLLEVLCVSSNVSFLVLGTLCIACFEWFPAAFHLMQTKWWLSGLRQGHTSLTSRPGPDGATHWCITLRRVHGSKKVALNHNTRHQRTS